MEKSGPPALQETEDVFGDDSEELQAKKASSFWRRRQFREVYLPVIACALLLTAAIMLRLYERQKVRHSVNLKLAASHLSNQSLLQILQSNGRLSGLKPYRLTPKRFRAKHGRARSKENKQS